MSPFVYWSRIAVLLSTERDKCRIYFFESIFAGAAVLFLYFTAISPPSRAFNIADVFIMIVVIGSTQMVATHYAQLTRKLGYQLDEAVSEASEAANEKS